MTNATNDVDVIKALSDCYHEMSLTLAGLLPTDAGYNDLEQRRAERGAKIDRLVREFTSSSTGRFVEPTSEIVKVNRAAKKALRELESMKAAIDAVTSLLKTVDQFIAAVFPLPA